MPQLLLVSVSSVAELFDAVEVKAVDGASRVTEVTVNESIKVIEKSSNLTHGVLHSLNVAQGIHIC